MKFTQIKTHWTTEEASVVMEFLDELRDTLWTIYGEDIIAMHQTDLISEVEENPRESEFNDEIPF
jgi:hypothetical protein